MFFLLRFVFKSQLENFFLITSEINLHSCFFSENRELKRVAKMIEFYFIEN